MVGVEDQPWWGKDSEHDNIIQACSTCKNTITLWHCADMGCPWCVRCVAEKTEQIKEATNE